MKYKWFKKLTPLWLTAIVLICLYFAGGYILDKLFGDICGNEIVQKLPSPNGDKVAYIFQRDCGATTGTSYQLSLLDSDEELPNESGNTFVSNKQFQIKWMTNGKLRVNYKKSSETHEMNKIVNWTKIEYIGN